MIEKLNDGHPKTKTYIIIMFKLPRDPTLSLIIILD